MQSINLGEFMSGDYETLEINQPKITYFQERSENNTEWLDELINQIEDMKNNISCLLYTSPSPRDPNRSRMPSSA